MNKETLENFLKPWAYTYQDNC